MTGEKSERTVEMAREMERRRVLWDYSPVSFLPPSEVSEHRPLFLLVSIKAISWVL